MTVNHEGLDRDRVPLVCEEITKRKSIFGAFALYGSFVTLFVWILQLVGVARRGIAVRVNGFARSVPVFDI